MPRFILIDHNSGYIFGDTADYLAGQDVGTLTPMLAAKLLDQSIGEHGRTYEECGPNYRPSSEDNAYYVYRADIDGSEAVCLVEDGQDQEMIEAVERDCELVAVVLAHAPTAD